MAVPPVPLSAVKLVTRTVLCLQLTHAQARFENWRRMRARSPPSLEAEHRCKGRERPEGLPRRGPGHGQGEAPSACTWEPDSSRSLDPGRRRERPQGPGHGAGDARGHLWEEVWSGPRRARGAGPGSASFSG